MPIDASIYSNVQAPQVNIPSPLDAAEKGMRLSELGMQQAQMRQQMQNQMAVRQAYANNTDPNTGSLNRASFLSDLGKSSPMTAAQYQNQFVQQDKQAADAKLAQMQAAHQTLSVTTPAIKYLLSLPDDQAAKAFPNVMQQMKDQGVPTANTPPSWDRGWAQQAYAVGSQMKEGLENQLTQANVAKTYSEANLAPAKLNNELYGRGSANVSLSSQYNDETKPIKSSQLAMNQMIDNYKNPTPQGDASLILNAYKIKFPNAPDVNSLEELSKSESAPNQLKQAISQRVNGLLPQNIRDDLMRDGISTFRANVDSLRGIQEKYQAKAKEQGVNPSITNEPAVDKTNAKAMDLQKQIGRYVPPSQQGGVISGAMNLASRLMGASGGQSANAGTSPPPAPQGMVRMVGPDGKSRLIPASMKGEAIAAGGKVVQ